MSDRWNTIAEQVRSRLKRLLLVRGLAWVFITLCGLVWFIGLVDWTVHLDAALIRILLSFSILGVSLFVLYRELVRPLLVEVSDVDVARLIERSQASADDNLASAAQFRATNSDPSLGSPVLQQVAIKRADSTVRDVDIDRVFSTRPVQQAVASAVLMGVIGVVTVLVSPLVAQTALWRLVLPLDDVPWPRATELQLLDADLRPLATESLRTTAGEPLTVYAENSLGELPTDLTLELMLPDDQQQAQTVRSTQLRDAQGDSHEVGIVTLLAYRGPLRFRVRGGDDDGTAWQALDVVPAPALTSMSISLEPPPYTRQPPTKQDTAGLIEGLVGTHVRIQAKASKRLAAAHLHREGHADQPITLSDAGRQLVVEFDIEEPGSSWYWIELVDEHGLHEPDPPRYELRGIADRPPVVYIDQPATDMSVTPEATVPLRVIAQDDLGLAALQLRHTDQVVTEEEPPSAETVSLELTSSLPTDLTHEEDWQLGPLGLSPGTRITFWVEAVDACDVGIEADSPAGQVGTSARRHLTVLSSEDKHRELAARQSGLLDTLEAVRDRQARARDITTQLRIQAELTQQLRAEDLELLKQAEQEQRDIRRLITDESSGLKGEVECIRSELDLNKIEAPEATQRLSALIDDLNDLDANWLSQIEQSLARGRKSAATSDSRSTEEGELDNLSDKEVAEQFQNAEDAQASALAVLADAANTLGGWKQRFRLNSELDAIVSDQRSVQQSTKDVGQRTLGKSSSRLSDQEQADLARLSERQRQLASRLDELLQPPTEPEEESDAESVTESSSNELLEQAREWLSQHGTAGNMHQAAESLKRNEIPSAVEAQEQVIAALRDFGQQLNESAFDNPEEMLSKLQEQQEEVEALRKEQEILAQTSQQALSPSADPEREQELQRLRKEQAELAEQADELARQLKRQSAGDAARTASRAAQRMRDAQSALEREQPQDVAENQQEALDDLEQLANELTEQQQQIERQQAQLQMRQLAETLRDLADRQQALATETIALNDHQTARGSWSRPLLRHLKTLTDQQNTLRDELSEQQDVVADLAVVTMVIRTAHDLMQSAVDALDEREIGESTIEAQQTAAARLLSVVDVLPPPETQGEEATPATSTPPGQPAPADSVPDQHIALQLRLLRQMQADINERTIELAEQANQEDASPDVSEQQQELAREQTQVAELARDLLQDFIDSQGLPSDLAPHDDEQP